MVAIVRAVRRRARPTPLQMTPPHSCVRMRTRVQGAKLSLDDDLDESGRVEVGNSEVSPETVVITGRHPKITPWLNHNLVIPDAKDEMG